MQQNNCFELPLSYVRTLTERYQNTVYCRVHYPQCLTNPSVSVSGSPFRSGRIGRSERAEQATTAAASKFGRQPAVKFVQLSPLLDHHFDRRRSQPKRRGNRLAPKSLFLKRPNRLNEYLFRSALNIGNGPETEREGKNIVLPNGRPDSQESERARNEGEGNSVPAAGGRAVETACGSEERARRRSRKFSTRRA